MHVELYCSKCRSGFAAAPETPAALVLDRAAAEGPWGVLGDGETCEDALAAALCGADHCPTCGEVATVSEESLGRLTLELLATW
jgi:hypothetical protein